jgi:RimJ/RimL family protein N-acetyltransferase
MIDRATDVVLVPADARHIEAEAAGAAVLAALLGVPPPPSWPPDGHAAALADLTRRLEADPLAGNWHLHYLLARFRGAQVLAGTATYGGPPDADGAVVVTCSVLPAFRRRGIATMALHAMVDGAFAYDDVRKVVAVARADNEAAAGLLGRARFRPSQPPDGDIIRYEYVQS